MALIGQAAGVAMTGARRGRDRCRSASRPPYAQRRALLAELGLEGVVAERRDSRYLPGRRTRAWVKHNLRSEEELAVTGIRRTLQGRVDAVWVARRRTDGSFAAAGSIELGLRPELVDVLEQRLAELPPRRRGRITWYPAEVSVLASVHGPSARPVRDAILRDVLAT